MICPSFEELSFARDDAAARAAIAPHLDTCEACKRTWLDMDRVRAAARELPWHEVDPVIGEARLVEAALLSRQSDRRRRALVGRVGFAAAAALILGLSFALTRAAPVAHAPDAIAKRATVRDADGARFVHEIRSTAEVAQDEVLELADGTVALDVAPLGPAQRFRVVAVDGEVEVRGTSFSTSVVAGHLARVAVTSGRVVVRPRGEPERVLGAGDVWVSSREDRPRSRAVEALFQRGWDALLAGDAASSEAAFTLIERDHPSDALAEDALYFRAVIAERGGRAADARALWRRFRAAHSGSPRAPEAAVMLGWLELEAGDVGLAKQLFAEGAGSSDAELKESAVRGLSRASELADP